MSALAFRPDWPAPAGVEAWVSERRGGVSTGAYGSLNLARHVGDDARLVEQNRERLAAALALPTEPVWLEQVHGSRVADLDAPTRTRQADGAVTGRAGLVCAVLTADCLPVLFASRDGRAVGIAHAGWRGLANGVLGNAVGAMSCAPADILAWLGPAISQQCYEVGDEVRETFVSRDASAEAAFERNARGRWQADLYALARLNLAACGVAAVYGGGMCTYREESRFFSHRREAPCGRMVSLIWRRA